MIASKVRVRTDGRGVKRALKKADFKSLKAAAAYVWRAAVNSIKTAKSAADVAAIGDEKKRSRAERIRKAQRAAAPPGKPPRSQTGLLKKSITFNVDEAAAVIGPKSSMIGPIGRLHEFGDANFRGRNYPARPFMRPALNRSLARLPKFWRNALKGGG